MNMRSLSVLLIMLFASGTLFAQKQGYVIYNAKGKKVSYEKMLKAVTEKDIVLFGELHNNPIAHWLQYELTVDLNEARDLILGAEMLEADNQDELDDYLAGKIDAKMLDSLARLWPNYKTDYKPLVDFAKENKLAFVASNIPRRYARMVHKKDFVALDTLPNKEKAWIAPLPIKFDPELPTYKNILTMMGPHGSTRLVKAQAIKDATMAHRILEAHKEGSIFLHYNGAYHSDQYEGILWYLMQDKPDMQYATISTVIQSDVNKLEEENKLRADFIICVDENMTTTY